MQPADRDPAGALLRLLALYVALIFGWQAVAAAFALGQGPLHRHRTDDGLAALVFSHHGDGHRDAHRQAHGHAQAHAHGQAHQTGERHAHDAQDSSVIAMADATAATSEEAPNTLAFALTSAMSLLALGRSRPLGTAAGAVLCAHRPWAFKTGPQTLLFRPPRTA